MPEGLGFSELASPVLPVIEVRAGDLHLHATAAEAAIVASGLPIFQRGPNLVRPTVQELPATHGRVTLSAGLATMTVPALLDVCCQVASWERFDGRTGGLVRTNPPKLVADVLLSRAGQWHLPVVAGVITTPTMRPDGSILSAAGYDAATRLYHAADTSLTLSPRLANPTRQDALAALDLLGGLLSEFPFVSPVARSVALAALLTPVCRGALPVVPLIAIRAHTAGTGKSYLVDVASAIATGRPCPVISAAPGDDAETEKRLAGLLLAGTPVLSIDNVNGELGGDLLCQAIERPFVRLRPLGRSDIIEIESRATVFATGNNLRVRGDMVRRSLVCDLDAGLERPELRRFQADPVSTVLADRGRYVSAVLVIVRAYVLAGQPSPPPPLASFEAWSSLVRGALLWLGTADPCASMEAARDDDPELTALNEMVTVWGAALGSVPTTCRDAINAATDTLRNPGLHEVLARNAPGRFGIDPTRLGRWLLSREGRIVGGRRFKRDGVTAGSARWALVQVQAEGG